MSLLLRIAVGIITLASLIAFVVFYQLEQYPESFFWAVVALFNYISFTSQDPSRSG